MVFIISICKHIYANIIFHSIFGGTHHVNIGDCQLIGVIETLFYPRKVKTDTHMPFVCSQDVVTIQDWTNL